MRNLLSVTIVLTIVMILSTASSGICSFSEHILWSLEARSGIFPTSNLLLDQAGNLYGTAEEGGESGTSRTVFELRASGDKTVIWSFSVENGAGPTGGLIIFPKSEALAKNETHHAAALALVGLYLMLPPLISSLSSRVSIGSPSHTMLQSEPVASSKGKTIGVR